MIPERDYTDLAYLLQNMEPYLHPHSYVFAVVPFSSSIKKEDFLMSFKEEEGMTLIMEKSLADQYQLNYDHLFNMITLKIHSDLDAVGFTAVFSNALAEENISCNVVSGYYHDHIFVDSKDGDKALNCLINLSNKYSSQ